MINIIWHGVDDPNAKFNCTAVVRDMLQGYQPRHYARNVPEGLDGAVVVVHGGREPNDIDRLNADLRKLPKWAVVIVLGDEENVFPVEKIQHPNQRLWISEPTPGRHNFCDRFLLNGYTPYTADYAQPNAPKTLDWAFAGQVTHERRQQCAAILRKLPNGRLVETAGYCQGIPLPDYYSLLSSAKVVPCPSGPHSPCAARPWEALECGAVPVLDCRSPRIDGHFWEMVIPGSPLPRVDSWADFPVVLEGILANFEKKQKECLSWWADYKLWFNSWLGEDLRSLSAY